MAYKKITNAVPKIEETSENLKTFIQNICKSYYIEFQLAIDLIVITHKRPGQLVLDLVKNYLSHILTQIDYSCESWCLQFKQINQEF